MIGLRCRVGLCLVVLVWTPLGASAGDQPAVVSSNYFPTTEEQGGWRTLLPAEGEPDDTAKARIREVAGVDWTALKAAWEHNASAPGATGLLVIRRGHVVGEWYKGGDRTTAFNIYSSSKSYTSTAFGLILSDFGNGPLPGGKTLSLDTKVCNPEWIPESLPLPDPRKAEITVRNFLNMASGLDVQNPPVEDHPFEWSLGHVAGSPMIKLLNDPGAAFHYSNAGVAHLVLLFHRAAGEDLFPFLKRRLFEPIGLTQVHWTQMGGPDSGGTGAIGPLSQGYSGILTNPRQHARFCYLAMHRGEWAGHRIVPASYYDFAWKGTSVKPDYGAQWWTQPHVPGAPGDLVMTLGRNHNDGFVVPSLDLVFVRLGDGGEFPKDFEKNLVLKVLAAVK
ncbi:MAG TPA: serine hydrolase [Isosphaeraceae bacterium]|nr:serine hydrolase [Isosphaeraceae bacterium]